MLYSQEKIIKEYWEEEKSKYPNLTYEEFSTVCKTPIKHALISLRLKELPTIMLKYIGKFRVFPARVKQEINNQVAYFEKGLIDETTYKDKTDHLKNFLMRFKNEENKEECLDDSE